VREEAAVDEDGPGPMVVAINVGESWGIGPVLITSIRKSTESPKSNTKKEKNEKSQRDIPPNRSVSHNRTSLISEFQHSSLYLSSSINLFMTIEGGSENPLVYVPVPNPILVVLVSSHHSLVPQHQTRGRTLLQCSWADEHRQNSRTYLVKNAAVKRREEREGEQLDYVKGVRRRCEVAVSGAR